MENPYSKMCRGPSGLWLPALRCFLTLKIWALQPRQAIVVTQDVRILISRTVNVTFNGFANVYGHNVTQKQESGGALWRWKKGYKSRGIGSHWTLKMKAGKWLSPQGLRRESCWREFSPMKTHFRFLTCRTVREQICVVLNH